jgi:hypothetical protein
MVNQFDRVFFALTLKIENQCSDTERDSRNSENNPALVPQGLIRPPPVDISFLDRLSVGLGMVRWIP